MANEKFTQLPTVTSAMPGDIIAAVQGGISVQETLQQVMNLSLANTILNFAGNPNGSVAGNIYQLLWDTSHSVLYVCTTSGSATTAVWTLAGSVSFPITIPEGGTGVTSVTTSPTPTAFAGWDTNKNLSANNFLAGLSIIATAAGTTTLTVASTYAQLFTGSTTQTVVMPVTSTLVLGQAYYISNTSSGNVTIQSSGANTIQVMAPGTTCYLTCISLSGTTAASWNSEYAFNGGSGSGTVNSGSINQLAYYAANGTAVSGLATANNSVLTTDGGGIPSLVPQLPLTKGGTNASLAASNGGIFYSTASAGAILSGTATAGLALLSGASTTPAWSSSPPVTRIATQVFTSSGTYTPTAGMVYCIIEAIAGGGAGGGAISSSGQSAGGGGGGAGSYSRKISTAATIGGSQTVTIGAAGVAGAAGNNPGGNGGDTSLGSICIAKGGTGGSGSATAGGGAGGAGGIAGTGDFTPTGQSGLTGAGGSIVTYVAISGQGASGIFGGGGLSVSSVASSNGLAASNYGSGGSGGISWNGGATANGGAGSKGVMIITEFLSV